MAPLAVSGLARAQATGDWLHISTPSFSLYGHVSEKTLIQMAKDLESFAGLLRSLHDVDATTDERPLPIYIVPRQTDLKRVQPSITNVAGFYSAAIGDIFAIISL